VIDNFLKLGWTIALKNQMAESIKYAFHKILITSRRKPNWIKTDRGKEFFN